MNRTYNTEPLIAKMEDVIKNGLDQILKEFMERYELLEKTHTQIMNLPSVRSELKLELAKPQDNSITFTNPNPSIDENSIKNIVNDLVNDKFNHIEKKFENIDQVHRELFPFLHKIMSDIDNLGKEMQALKEQHIIKPSIVSPCENDDIIKPSIVSACENENIQFDIEEKEVEEQVEEELEEEEEQELEEQELEEEEEEEVVEEEEEVEEELEEEEEVEEVEVKEDVVETETESETSNEDEDEEETKEEEDEEIFEIEIDDTTYCTNNDENGFIYQLNDGEVGEKVGYFKESETFFYADEN